MTITSGSSSQNDPLIGALRQARHISLCQADDLDRARLELTATRARFAEMALRQEAMLMRVAVLEQAMAQLEAENIRLHTLMGTAGSGALLTNTADLHAEVAKLAKYRDELHHLRQSFSWRATRPLRALRQPRLTLRILLDSLGRR